MELLFCALTTAAGSSATMMTASTTWQRDIESAIVVL
jgi:hypothetical protein